MVHHLFPQVMDFGLKTPVLCKTRIKLIKSDSQVCIQTPVLHGKEEINLMTELRLKVSPVKKNIMIFLIILSSVKYKKRMKCVNGRFILKMNVAL